MIPRKVNMIRTQIHSDGLPNSKLPKTKMSYLDLSNAIFLNTNLYCANLFYADFPLVNPVILVLVIYAIDKLAQYGLYKTPLVGASPVGADPSDGSVRGLSI